MRRLARVALCIVAAAMPFAAACNAIVGVTDVSLAKKDAGGTIDDPDAEILDDGGAPGEAGPGTPQVELALGFLHSCARRLDGTVACWGENSSGELGDGKPVDGGTRPPALSPQPVSGVSDAIAIAAGVSHTCIVRQGGLVACWGYNYFGQLGDNTNDPSGTAHAVNGITDATGVVAGTSFSCALRTGGTMVCWGANYAGQLGDGTKQDRGSPVPVAGLSGVIAMAAGEKHACAIVTGDIVKCWGGNDDGQLGNGSTSESLSPATVPSLSDIVQVVGASRFTCARQRSGQIYCWGANNYGQLGNGISSDAPNPSPVLTQVNDAIHMWVGYEHACAVRRSGQVVCWGRAADGQIGAGTPDPDASVANPTPTQGITAALAVSTGGDHSCASTRTGNVYCWGSNSLGQCGNGGNGPTDTATRVDGL